MTGHKIVYDHVTKFRDLYFATNKTPTRNNVSNKFEFFKRQAYDESGLIVTEQTLSLKYGISSKLAILGILGYLFIFSEGKKKSLLSELKVL